MAHKDPSNIDIALFALYRRGGAERPVDPEDVAFECWQLAPAKFSWKKYPHFPDSDTALEALYDACREKYGRLCRRRARGAGWMLTVAGVDYLRSKLPGMEALARGTTRMDAQHTKDDRYFAALERNSAYRKYVQLKSCERVEAHEFTELLRCSVDTSPRVLRERLETLKTRARERNRDVFLEFLQACEHRFAAMLAGD